jgi:hypothetical protein
MSNGDGGQPPWHAVVGADPLRDLFHRLLRDLRDGLLLFGSDGVLRGSTDSAGAQ